MFGGGAGISNLVHDLSLVLLNLGLNLVELQTNYILKSLLCYSHMIIIQFKNSLEVL